MSGARLAMVVIPNDIAQGYDLAQLIGRISATLSEHKLVAIWDDNEPPDAETSFQVLLRCDLLVYIDDRIDSYVSDMIHAAGSNNVPICSYADIMQGKV